MESAFCRSFKRACELLWNSFAFAVAEKIGHLVHPTPNDSDLKGR
jgi:hypothetical protein